MLAAKRKSLYNLDMNKLPIHKRAQLLNLLVEGNSLRATGRLADVAYNSVLKFVVDMGIACAEYQDTALRNLACKRVQVDEIWSFVGAKEKNASPEQKAEGYGDIWTWTAIDPDSKLAVSWLVGNRDAECANAFMQDIADRLANQVQLTSDGHRPYLEAVDRAFAGYVDYAQLVKIYGEPKSPTAKSRTVPNEVVGIRKVTVEGQPDPKHISTSMVERQNLTMRMGIRRFTRLTNAFSKKAENHAHAVSMHFMYYNFGRIHKTLRVTPAMQAGLADHVWSFEEIIELMDAKAITAKRGPYKKKVA